MKILAKDKVYVIKGKDAGKSGEVARVITKTNKVVIPGINTVKKAVKATQKNPAGGIIEIAKPIAIANVAVVCPKCGKPARIGYSIAKDGKKVRVCKKCSGVVKE